MIGQSIACNDQKMTKVYQSALFEQLIKYINFSFSNKIMSLLQGIFRHFGKYAYLLSCWKLDEKIDTTLY